MKLIEKISRILTPIQQSLFPEVEKRLESDLSDKEKDLIRILEIIKIERYVHRKAFTQAMGRKLKEREAISRFFVAKAFYEVKNTKGMIEMVKGSPSLMRICGFHDRSSFPSEPTFSRAYQEFSASKLLDVVHKELIDKHLKPELIGHISRDSSAIEAREKPKKKDAKPKRAPRKRGRPSKGEIREARLATRIEQQKTQPAEEALKGLPTACDVGTKKNSKGYKESWRGYKLHVDVCDCGLPISAVLTSASVHDSQVAIPLMKMSSERVTYFYDVMDSAYDAGAIYEASRFLGHVPIIDKNPRVGNSPAIPMAPHEAVRYNERSAVERFFSRMKDSFGARNVMVRGAEKVKTHLMFGIIALFADQLIKLAS